jgi:GNAT superfamily N-acetyltransferase
MDKTTFEQSIHRNWADHFGCPLEITNRPGATLLQEEKYRGNKEIALWRVGKHTFVQLDPDYLGLVQSAVAQLPAGEALTADALVAMLGAKQVSARDRSLALYLDPGDLPTYAPPTPYIIRPLTLADAGALIMLKGFMTSEEVDDGFVEVEHQIAFGCFSGRQMVAASSGYERTGFMDIGVLTHSAFRRKGLGKAVVGALCAWSAENGYIAQYRHNVENVASARVAHSLNFKPYAEEEAIWMNQD